MQKITSAAAFRACVIAADAAALLYFAFYIYWVFSAAGADHHPLTGFFTTVNPMTVGSYFMGGALLLHMLAFKGVFGRCLMGIPYGLSVLLSLIAMMGMTGWKDLLMYVPHGIILCLAVVIIVKQYQFGQKGQR